MNRLISFCIIALFLFVNTSLAQPDSISRADSLNADSIAQASRDSLNNAVMEEYKKQLQRTDSIRLQDSIQRALLEAKIKQLSTTDNLDKELLQKQLNEIAEKENSRLLLRKAHIDSIRNSATAYPVTGFLKDTLYLIYNRLGSLSPKDRAKAISDRIKDVAADILYTSDTLYIRDNESTTDILFGEKIIMSISEDDALWNNMEQKTIAVQYMGIIGKALEQYKSDTSFWTIAKHIGLAILVLIVIAVLVYFLRKFFNWTSIKIQAQEGIFFKGITIKNYTLLDAKREVVLILLLNAVMKWFFTLFFIYISLPIIFGIFPWTKNIAETLFGFVWDPVKKVFGSLWDYFPNLFTIIVILIVFRYVLKAIHYIKDEIEKGHLTIPGFYEDWANPTYHLVKLVVIAFMIIVIFPYLPGSDSAIFQGVSVFLGFLFTISSAGSLSNIIAGLILTYMRLFKLGDRVKIGDVTGDVIEKSLLVVRVRTPKNEIITIPNSTVMNSYSINYSSDALDRGLIVYSTVTIGYDVDWKEMHEALIEAALRTEHILKEPKPFVLQTSLDDFYVSYQINGYTKEPNKQAGIYSELHKNILDVCNEKGIEIMSPHYMAARDGNAVAKPSEYIPESYIIPGFNIKINK